MSVLDQSLISELREVMGDDFSMLVESYERDGVQRLQSIDEAVSAGSAEDLRAMAHSFKGSSGNVGAAEVAKTCLALEECGRSGDLTQAQSLLAPLKAQFQAALDELRS